MVTIGPPPGVRLTRDIPDDKQATVSVAPSASGTSILKFTTKNARRAFIVFFGQSWDAAGEPGHVTYRLKAGGVVQMPFYDSKVQTAAPEQPLQEISPWIEVPQQSEIEMTADVDSTPVVNINITGRVRVVYAEIDTGL